MGLSLRVDASVRWQRPSRTSYIGDCKAFPRPPWACCGEDCAQQKMQKVPMHMRDARRVPKRRTLSLLNTNTHAQHLHLHMLASAIAIAQACEERRPIVLTHIMKIQSLPWRLPQG